MEQSIKDMSLGLTIVGTILTFSFGVWLFQLRNKKKFYTKSFISLFLIGSIVMLGYGINFQLNLVPYLSKPVYPTLTSSAPKEQIELNADLLITMLPKEAKNCNVLDSMHMDIKEKIKETADDPNTSENLKINNDLFNIISYKLSLNCSTKK